MIRGIEGEGKEAYGREREGKWNEREEDLGRMGRDGEKGK